MKKSLLLFSFLFAKLLFAQELPVEVDNNKNKNPGNELYTTAGVEMKPEYPGGIEAFYKYIQKKYKAPTERNFKGGKVIVGFVVEKDGSLTDIQVLKDAGFGTDKEAVRVIENSKKWKPAMQLGVPVRCSYVLPILLQSN